MADVRDMQLGQVVDYCMEYNEREKQAEAQAERNKDVKHYRFATQNEIDAYFKR